MRRGERSRKANRVPIHDVGGESCAHDANGNLTSDGNRTLAWDAANRLARVTMAGGAVDFAYGPDG